MNSRSTLEFLSYLRNLNVKLSADGDRLRYSAPSGVMTSDLLDELAARKTGILEFITNACLASRPQAPTMKRIHRDGELPLSFAQARLWLLNQLEPGTATYNIPRWYRLKGNLNLAVFEQSLSEIVRRHEVLRAYFLTMDGRPVQKIAPPEPFQVPVVDLQALPEMERQMEAERIAFVDARQPFDLGKAPLMRATLLKEAPEEQILLLNMYHIAFDAWSFGIFMQEMSVLYGAFLNGKPSPLPELPIQYVDFAAWQREWLQGKVLQTQLDYWKERLSGSLPVLELPTDRPRPAVQTSNGGDVSFAFSKQLTEALRSLSQREDVTLFVTLLAAFNVLLLRYTGQEDLLVGTPIANRNRAEIEGLIGFFVNTLVMRSDLSGNPSFRELLGRVQETALGAYAHQDLPFEKLVEELNPERDLSRSPIIQVLLSLQNTPMRPLELSGLEARRLTADSGTSKFDLSLYAIEIPEGLSCNFEYNTDLFDADRIERMVGHFQVLLEGIVAHPEQRLSEVPLLPESEKHRLRVEWNQTWADFPRGKCIHDLMEEQVERTPTAVALAGPSLTQASTSQVSWTYAELNQRANALAYYLQALGVGPEVLVAVCMERTVEMVVGLLAVLKAGGAYVPLDPAYPSERLAFILEETQLPVVLTQRSIAGFLPSYRARVVCLDDPNLLVETQKLTGDDFRFSSNPQDQSHLAYVLYTSGSTGKPKGVEICHRAVVNFLNSMRVVPGMEAHDTLLSVTTLSFDIFGLEIWLPLTTGAKVVIVPEEAARDGRELAAVMRRSGATVMQATPSTWRLLLESGWEGNPHLKILCGGEAWPPQLAEQLLPKCASLWNMYGPTETTIWSAVHPVEKGKPILIGRPIANTQFYVVDSHLQAVPVGVPGELLIGGEGLARGYLHRPELTTEKFIANPFSTGVESRLYRTGDFVRYLADGNLEFLGRIDQQVKIRGFRIELGEIEAVLAEHPEVKAAAVVAPEDTFGDKRLVAYIVPEKGQSLMGDTLRSFLKRKLPEYMLPSRFEFLEALPLTPNGKVNRRALPAPDSSRPEAPESFVAPRCELEEKLARIWTQLLRLEQVGVHDNFFDLGGHSLLAVKLIARIEQVLGERVQLVTLFQAPTIGELAAILSGQNHPGQVPGVVPIHAAGSKAPFFWVGATPRYRPLGQRMASGQPFLGLHLQPSQVGQLSLPYKLEEFAACLIKTMRAVQPEGPYYLGGFCLNGVLAYEIARQLRAGGEDIALLLLFDAWNPEVQRPMRGSQAGTFGPKLRFHLANLQQLEMKQVPAYFLTHLRWFVDRVRTGIWKTAYGLKLHMGNGRLSDPDQIREVAGRAYRPGPYAGRVVLFQTSKRPVGPQWDLTSGWRELVAGPLEVHEIPGDHESVFFGQELEYLASQLTACLLEAQAAWDGKQRIGELRT